MNLRLISAISLLFLSTALSQQYDLIVRDVTLFDVHTKTTKQHQTIAVRSGTIAGVFDHQYSAKLAGKSEISGGGKLVTPGFIDVHFHTGFLLADSITIGGGGITHLSVNKDSVERYRSILADAYLPYGITAVRDAGSAEKNLPILLDWMKRRHDSPDFWPVGGAMVSHEEGRIPYEGHVVVLDSLEASLKVQQYYDSGIRDVKLYWRLRQKEFDSAFRKAFNLGMNVCAHIDYKVLGIEHALQVGVRNFEHAYTLGVNIAFQTELDSLGTDRERRLAGRSKALFLTYVTDLFNAIGKNDPRMMALIGKLRKANANVTPTLHLFAQPFGLSYFRSKPRGNFDDTSDLTHNELRLAIAGYDNLGWYVKEMFDKGVQLNIGTDCSNPGKSALSEMLLLNKLGIPMADVIVIASLNGAKAIGRAHLYGSIEVGKRANLIVFEKDPLSDPNNLLLKKLVIKDGVVYD